MSITVEHDKRRQEILKKALDVFVEEGFENATFLKIAGRCGITRTTLYIYFKNKKEIFNYSIRELLQRVEQDILGVKKDQTLDSIVKLTRVIALIFERLEKNKRLLSVILNYLLYLSKSDSNPDHRVRRRTIRMRHILATILIEGIRAGEIKPINVHAMNDILYGFIETAVFRLTVLQRPGTGDLQKAVEQVLNQIRA
jgi:AcrR family transcriptional regulator